MRKNYLYSMWKTSKKKYFEIRNKILMRKNFPQVKNYFSNKNLCFLIGLFTLHLVTLSLFQTYSQMLISLFINLKSMLYDVNYL